MDPESDIHNQHYIVQGQWLGVSHFTVRRAVKRWYPTARRYKKAQTKHLSATNKRERIAYGFRHRKRTLRDFWRWIYFTDEAHFNSEELSTKPQWELREAGAQGRLENLNERVKPPFNLTVHIAAGCSYDSKGPLIFYNDPADPTAPKPYRPRAPRRSSVETAEQHHAAVQTFKTEPNGPEIELKPKGNAMSMRFYTKYVLPHHINHIHKQEARHGRTIYFIEDNDGSHGSRSAKNMARQVKDDGHITSLSHPPNSPCLNPQEPVWRAMKSKMRGGTWHTLDEFKDAIRDAYRHVKQKSIRRYISEMPWRCRKVIELRGRRIRSKWW
jgi:hypothetical protein